VLVGTSFICHFYHVFLLVGFRHFLLLVFHIFVHTDGFSSFLKFRFLIERLNFLLLLKLHSLVCELLDL
jgi:hypothetical protein